MSWNKQIEHEHKYEEYSETESDQQVTIKESTCQLEKDECFKNKVSRFNVFKNIDI